MKLKWRKAGKWLLGGLAGLFLIAVGLVVYDVNTPNSYRLDRKADALLYATNRLLFCHMNTEGFLPKTLNELYFWVDTNKSGAACLTEKTHELDEALETFKYKTLSENTARACIVYRRPPIHWFDQDLHLYPIDESSMPRKVGFTGSKPVRKKRGRHCYVGDFSPVD